MIAGLFRCRRAAVLSKMFACAYTDFPWPASLKLIPIRLGGNTKAAPVEDAAFVSRFAVICYYPLWASSSASRFACTYCATKSSVTAVETNSASY